MPIRFGRYLLLRRRSLDPIGEEFLAAWGVDEGVDQLRYVRGIYTAVAEEAQFVGLFSEEARSLSRLASANVLRVVEVGVEGGIPFVACEYVEGLTLERLIELAEKQQTNWPWELAVHVATELLRGLDYVHRREDIFGKPMGMRHGDVRPTNAIISFDGEVKLWNFGSALFFIADERTNARVQTCRGIYAPPEASAVDEATVAGDLWGVSAILSTLLRGKESLVNGEEISVESPPYPKEIESFLTRALHRSPKRRYCNAGNMRDDLLAIMRAHSLDHAPDNLARWTRSLGNDDRVEEAEIVRTMLGQDAQMSLGETAGVGRIGPGTVVDGRYHLQRLLGEGGMGMVFEAEHLGLGRRVAVKVLHERVLDDDIAIERFRREARITGSLGHANIIGVSDFGVTGDGHHYLAMDLLEGESLADRIQRGAINSLELARIMVQVCDGLEAAHKAGVVHRDLKPENIFVTPDGPRIVDFGIAKHSGLDDKEQSLTRTGNICGTAEYLAPEQVKGQDPDFRCDIYAVGVMIYEGLTKETPFRGRTLGETLHKVMVDKVVPPRKRSGNIAIPKGLEAICLRALARNPAKRYASASEMASALSAFLDSERREIEAIPLSFPKQRIPFWLSCAGTVVLAFISVAVFFRFGNGASKETETNPIEKSEHFVVVENPTSRGIAPPKETDEASPVGDGNRDKQAFKTPETPQKEERVRRGERASRREPSISKEKKSTEKERDDEVTILLLRANRELGKMNVDKAAALFERVIIVDPKIARAWYGLGRASFEQGRYDDAAKRVEYALRLSPGAKRWRIYLGKVYRAMGQNDRAIEEWRRVLKSDPHNDVARGLLKKSGVNEGE